MAGKDKRTTTPDVKKDLVLVAVSGDVEPGLETPIPPDKPLLVGRSAKGLQLTDPLVSIQHAEIRAEPKRGWVVHDLDSATGTWVDEECVKGESRPIGIGTRLRFGDTVFEIQPPRRAPRWIRPLLGVLALVALVPVVALLVQFFSAPAQPKLLCAQQGVVVGRSEDGLEIPVDFLRTRGLSAWDLKCMQVTDHDFDGRDEVWISLGNRGSAVVTFDDGMAWKVLGEFPEGCEQRRATEGPDSFPELQCGGELWLMVDGRYGVVAHEGVVVWYRQLPSRQAPEPPAKGKGKPKSPAPAPVITTELPGLEAVAIGQRVEVGRFALKSTELLGSFLAVRGVTDPVHYVICEEAFEGIRAQALTERGQVVDLGVGCISDLRLEGNLTAKPVAFALSPSGRRALIDDVIRFYAGSPDGLFLQERWRTLISEIETDPGYLKGAIKLIGDSKESDAARLDPMPDPRLPVRASHALQERDSRLVPAPLAVTATIVAEGRLLLDPPGCAALQVDTLGFQTYGLYKLLPSTFLAITETGCEGSPRRVVKAGYNGGTWDVRLPGLDLRLVTEGGPSLRGLEVRRARITWRERPD